MMKTDYGTFESKIIYIFTIPDNSHNNRLKIGDTTFSGNPYDEKGIEQAARKRIEQYTKTADIEFNLLHVELAITNNGEFFRDYQVHNVLKRSGIIPKIGTNGRGREWFRIGLDVAIKAINAVKEGKSSISNNRENVGETPILFRPEQEKAIIETLESIKKGKNKKLWNAKMRFGKTLTALEVAKRSKFSKTIIITHRPVVSEGWFKDFDKIFYGTNYSFGSKKAGENLTTLLKKNIPFVYFISMQDLRRSKHIGGEFEKNKEIFEVDWDMVIVDEAHEGNKTELAQNVHRNINRKFTLGLSGTPFNLFEDYEDDSDIFTWDYVMEQEAKFNWENENFGDSNPYASLPQLSIFTFHLEKEFVEKKYIEFEDKAFNFREFFKTFPDDYPDISKKGEFVHKSDVKKFLDLITHSDEYKANKTNFPFSTEDYRENLRNTLWLLPGVREARALSKLMKEHHIFGQFQIVNVAGVGDDDSENLAALKKVQEAVEEGNDYTITITCGRLTTGVSVPEWTAVMMLSNTTSPSTYLQTAFRVQTPANIDGKMKTQCYVFDFAPDRTLKMVAQAARLNVKAGKINSDAQKQAMKEFLNFCPIISLTETKMKQIDVFTMLRQLKKAAVERVVMDGFDHNALYSDELLRLTEEDLASFKELQKIIGKSKQSKPLSNVVINKQGFDEEEWSEAEKIDRKEKKTLTDEEKEALKKRNELLKQRRSLISILRGISIRIPMMIFGANIKAEEEITVDNFVDLIDDLSWKEFMPSNVTKEMFVRFSKYYDRDVFVEAGLKIRRKAKAADIADTIKERINRITDIFATFKNPDKETVLTPWRVVNMQMGNTLGGEVFYDSDYQFALTNAEETRKIDKGQITKQSINSIDSKFLEINSKSGLYPLWACYNIYRAKVNNWRATKKFEILNRDKHFDLWNESLKENIFVIAKTPMAKLITERTLRGYQNCDVNVIYYDIIKETIDESEGLNKKLQKLFKNRGEKELNFDVVIGNPPYQSMDGGAQASAVPLYHHFVRAAKQLNPTYISMIMPSRWYVGGRGLDSFREEMLNDKHIREIHDWLTPENIFPNTNIRGGVCYFLWDANYDSDITKTRVITYEDNKVTSDVMRNMRLRDVDIFIRNYNSLSIIEKILDHKKNLGTIMNHVSALRPFGLRGYFTSDEKFHSDSDQLRNPLRCYGKGVVGYVERNEIKVKSEWIDSWKIFTSRANNIGTELNDDNFNTIIGHPKDICTETYVVIGADLKLDKDSVLNLSKYLKTKFSRYLHSVAKGSQDAAKSTYRFIPLQNFTEISDIDWNKPLDRIDEQLYKKYNLTQEEIVHIEAKIKEMK